MSTPPPLPNGPPADPKEAATYWSARRRLGLTSPAEEAVFRSWLADPAHQAAFDALERPLEALGQALSHPDARPLVAAARAYGTTARRRHKGRAGLAIISALAASFAFLALVSGLWNVQGSEGDSAGFEPPAASGAPAQRYVTLPGARRELTLADGSRVSLNTDSEVAVDYTEARRGVRLLRGQALFQVAKHQDRPFVVFAGGRQVLATGTAFDVRLDGDQVKVVLLEGRVTVAPATRSGLQRQLPGLAERALAPGEQLIAAPQRPSAVTTADLDRATSWRWGQAIFREDRLAVAVAEMNRYSSRPLTIEDPRIADLQISGVFRTDKPENFEAAVLAYFPLTIQTRPDGAHVLSWKDRA